MDDAQINALREAAEAAIPGPWELTSGHDYPSVIRDLALHRVAEAYTYWTGIYIAAASPDVVLSLLDRLGSSESRAERAERERDALQRHYDAAAPEHNLLALLDLYAEREQAAIARAERAEAELADANRRISLMDFAQTLLVEDAFAEAVERIASVQRIRWVDCVTGEYMEAMRGVTRATAAQGVATFFGLLRLWTAARERDEAKAEVARLTAVMPDDAELSAIRSIYDDKRHPDFVTAYIGEWLERLPAPATKGGE